MHGRELLEMVTNKRIEMIHEEVKECYPGSEIKAVFQEDGRVRLSVLFNESLIGEEYVETAESWNNPERMNEYRKALIGKARLVVLVPERHARAARLKMLDLNHWWLFYYMVFGYDHEGNIKRIGRPMFCHAETGYA